MMQEQKDKKTIDDSVKVAVRIRPLVHSEISRGCQEILNKTPGSGQIMIRNNVSKQDLFTFDYAFSPDETQEMVYGNAVKPIVQKLFKGYNVTILAYGQTGSGKTHTMGTAFDGNESEEIGVIPRAVEEIFENVNSMPEYSFNITCSFMELYQEQLYDLLSENGRDNSIVDIREDTTKGIFIPNLREMNVTCAHDATECLMKGSAGRAVGATAMNATSSRSHAIFTITIQMTKKLDPNCSTNAKFHLVDLAGSERSKKTKATGDRFKEGVKINQGLLALGNVISALGSSQQSNGYIKYRDSKLTRLLQDSLGGNSVTLMIACVSPADYNLDETLSTLRYADRAKQIKNKPIVNQDPKTAEINRLNGIIQKLRMDLLTRGVPGTQSTNLESTNGNVVEKYQCANELLETKGALCAAKLEIVLLSKRFEATIQDNTNLNIKLSYVESSNDNLHAKMGILKAKITELNTSFNADSCPAEFVIQGRAVTELKNIICEMSDEVRDTIAKAHLTTENDVTTENGSDDNHELHEVAREFQSKQLTYQEELRDIQKQLALKTELHEKLNGNYSNLCSFEEGFKTDGKIKDYETIIANLEKEKDEMKDTLLNKTTNVSVKLAEERRKRVQALEQEIIEMKKQNNRQALLLRQREKDHGKIVQMENEIFEMKQKKVKLIRAMKAENEEFRKWKLNYSKEVVQLREKDRKRDVEMRKNKMLHEKQRNVLKRKVEEALQINKRLKDALDKHKMVQAQRKKTPTTGKAMSEHIHSWVNNEIEMMYSVADAKNSLEQLIEDRADINGRLTNLKKVKNPQSADIELISTLQEDMEMRNAQIADFQEKIKTSDVDSIIKNITEGLNSMPEAKAAVKNVFNSLFDLRIEFGTNLTKLKDLRLLQETSDEKTKATDDLYHDKLNEYKRECERLADEKNLCESEYEQKVSVLLQELNNAGKMGIDDETKKIQMDTLYTFSAKTKSYEMQIKNLEAELKKFKYPMAKIRTRVQQVKNEDISDISDISYDDFHLDDDPNDPDWHKTPIPKRGANRTKSQEASLTSDNSGNQTKTFIHDHSAERRRCSCRTDCKSKVCGCRKSGMNCSDLCKCPNTCVNIPNTNNTGQTSSTDSEKQEMVTANNMEEDTNDENTFVSAKREFGTDESTDLDDSQGSPKKAKLSVRDQLHITTTPYPYNQLKKRKPLLQI